MEVGFGLYDWRSEGKADTIHNHNLTNRIQYIYCMASEIIIFFI